jgi:hypothetical protein
MGEFGVSRMDGASNKKIFALVARTRSDIKKL